MFNCIKEILVENGAINEGQSNALQTIELQQDIIPLLINENIDGDQLAKAVGKACALQVYSSNSVLVSDESGSDWMLVDTCLYVVNPLDSARIDEYRLMKQKGELDFSVIGVLPYGLVHNNTAIRAKSMDNKSEAKASTVLRNILELAIMRGASDIHIDPHSSKALVKMRCDSSLGLVDNITIPLNKENHEALTNVILSKCGKPTGGFNSPIDGQFQWMLSSRSLNIRVAVISTTIKDEEFPKLTLRLLNQDTSLAKIDRIGLYKPHLEQLKKTLLKPHGLFLVTGPTGSGKTTTLYAILNYLHSVYPDKSFFTLEDPVEIENSSYNQVQINKDAGLSFYTGIVALLRHDPDILMIGEIRDKETAEEAVRAAMTGHLVLSTLHTNSALDALPRLLNLGIDPAMLMSVLLGVTAQRTVRRVCPKCSTERRFDDLVGKNEEYFKYPTAPKKEQKVRVANKNGCNECTSGYKGRHLINEQIIFTPEISGYVEEGSSIKSIREIIYSDGKTDLYFDALRLISNNVTTISEVTRVLGPL